MNFFIFQSRVDEKDLRTRLVQDKDDSWRATRYRGDMNPNDFVYFWMAGPPDIRGIYGWGDLLSKPFKVDDSYRVNVRYRRRLQECVPWDRVKAKSDLGDLMIFTVGVGTNFLISRKEARLIASLIPQHERPTEL